MSKVSIRFFNDREVRAIWDDEIALLSERATDAQQESGWILFQKTDLSSVSTGAKSTKENIFQQWNRV